MTYILPDYRGSLLAQRTVTICNEIASSGKNPLDYMWQGIQELKNFFLELKQSGMDFKKVTHFGFARSRLDRLISSFRRCSCGSSAEYRRIEEEYESLCDEIDEYSCEGYGYSMPLPFSEAKVIVEIGGEQFVKEIIRTPIRLEKYMKFEKDKIKKKRKNHRKKGEEEDSRNGKSNGNGSIRRLINLVESGEFEEC